MLLLFQLPRPQDAVVIIGCDIGDLSLNSLLKRRKTKPGTTLRTPIFNGPGSNLPLQAGSAARWGGASCHQRKPAPRAETGEERSPLPCFHASRTISYSSHHLLMPGHLWARTSLRNRKMENLAASLSSASFRPLPTQLPPGSQERSSGWQRCQGADNSPASGSPEAPASECGKASSPSQPLGQFLKNTHTTPPDRFGLYSQVQPRRNKWLF